MYFLSFILSTACPAVPAFRVTLADASMTPAHHQQATTEADCLSALAEDSCLACRMNNPTATLFGFGQNSTQTSIIVTLASPQANAQAQVCFCTAQA